MEGELPVLELLAALVIIIAAAKASGVVAVRLGQPAVLGELAAGVILGPSVIDLFAIEYFDVEHLEPTVLLLAQLGVIFLMFLAGLETDLAEVAKVRRVAILAGTLGVVFPLATGTFASLPFGFSAKEAIFVGIILSATSVSISARTLMELGVLQGRQGVSILAAAVIDDVLVILVLSFFVAFAVDDGGGGGGAGEVFLIVGRVALFFVVAYLIGRFALPAIARWSGTAPISEGVLVVALVIALSYAWFAEEVGEVALITGAFMAGVLLRPTEVHRIVDEKVRAVGYGFFVPIFFIGVGLSANARNFEASDIGLLAVISVVAVVSKLAGSGLGAYLGGEGLRGSTQIGTGMISRGEVGLIVASVGLGAGLVDESLFSVTVLMVLITTLVTPIMLRVVFAGTGEPEQAEEEKEGQHA